MHSYTFSLTVVFTAFCYVQNTPQKPPRKKPVNAAMVKGTSLEKEEPHVSTSSEDQYRSNSLGLCSSIIALRVTKSCEV